MSAASLATPAVRPRRRSDEELKALVEEFNAGLEARLAADPEDEPTSDEVAAWAAQHFTGSLAVACSMASKIAASCANAYVLGAPAALPFTSDANARS